MTDNQQPATAVKLNSICRYCGKKLASGIGHRRMYYEGFCTEIRTEPKVEVQK